MDIIFQQLSHIYQDRKGQHLLALEKIHQHITSGQFCALIGPSGCGKSTLLRLAAGLLTPSRGSILLGGQSPQAARAAKNIGWMAQSPALLPWRTVLENTALAQRINPQNSRPLLPPEELLDLVGLAEFAQAYPNTLSGGMQHRVALARTLALGAPIWLMDEPFASLDELTREILGQELLGLWSQFRPTILWVTHSIAEAVRLADRVLVMSPRPGRILADLPVRLPRPRQETSSEFQAQIAKLKFHLRDLPMQSQIEHTDAKERV